jgi:hypothetical protein
VIREGDKEKEEIEGRGWKMDKAISMIGVIETAFLKTQVFNSILSVKGVDQRERSKVLKLSLFSRFYPFLGRR